MKHTSFMLAASGKLAPCRYAGLRRGGIASQDARPILNRPDQRTQQSNVMRRENESGFTLIELLIAIVLVGILAAVAIVGLTGVTKSGNNSACKSAVASAQTAAATYYANTGAYPTTFDVLVPPATPPLLTVPSTVTAIGTKMYEGRAANPIWSVSMQGGGSNTPNKYVTTDTDNQPCT